MQLLMIDINQPIRHNGIKMRTTLSLDDDLFDLTKRLAEQRKLSLSESVNFLIRRGLQSSVKFKERNGFAVFDVPEGTPRFGPKDVERAMNEEDAEYASYFRER